MLDAQYESRPVNLWQSLKHPLDSQQSESGFSQFVRSRSGVRIDIVKGNLVLPLSPLL